MNMDFVCAFELEYGRVVNFSRIMEIQWCFTNIKCGIYEPFQSCSTVTRKVEGAGHHVHTLQTSGNVWTGCPVPPPSQCE